MEYRVCGRTSLTTSVIGLGTWPIGGLRYGPSDDREAVRTIHAAVDAGITCIDTAPSYGNGHAEELVGRALSGRRDRAVLVTKGGLVWDERGRVLGRDSRPQTLRAQLAASLERMRTDYVDLYLVHWPDPRTPVHETMTALEACVRDGMTRYIGVSNFTGTQLRACAAALREVPLTVNQVSLSLFDRRWARDVTGTCVSLGVGLMAYGPLAHGLLAGTVTASTVFEESDWRKDGVLFGQPLLTPDNLPRNLAVVERLTIIAGRRGLTLPQLALAWVLAQEAVAVALVGARTPQEITEAAGAATVRLDQETLREIEETMQGAAGLSDVMPA
jgi:aryl-alcohol dehydrogenase-like predicted oxidoreductase